MKIYSVTVKGFRCFGSVPTVIKLSDGITALVGANGSGKTALLEALLRVFGVTSKQRTVVQTDFHVPPGTSDDDRSSRELYIDVRLIFPELEKNGTSRPTTVPTFFHHLAVDQLNGTPFVRLRLDAKWVDDGTVDGDVQQKLSWILTNDESPKDDKKRPCEPTERGFIQVHYVPATRDPSSQLTSAGALVGRLLRAVAWSPETQQSIQAASQQIREVFGKESAITSINQTLGRRWKDLHDDAFDAEPEFNIASQKFEEIIRRLNVVFRPNELNGERELDALSDGQKSLFYFSLVASVFEVERKLIYSSIGNNSNKLASSEASDKTELDDIEQPSRTGFHSHRLQTPTLVVFAFEEPENHLAPYFLSRIIKQVRSLVEEQTAQAVLTSHSPAILGRVKPVEVRHFRLDLVSRSVIVREIKLPDTDEDAAKYVREAVSVYPELYFARFVILGEGDSEQVVLPRLASAMGLEVDPAFVAIVPLGGRHVNHFWKLLNDLNIPHATLLDLDFGREGAGWGRIKYACEQLLAVGVAPDELLRFRDGRGNEVEFSQEDLKQLHKRTGAIEELFSWSRHLEKFNVFFSSPLDLDMAMLSCFPDAYKAIALAKRGPNIPSVESPEYMDFLEKAAKTVLGNKFDLTAYPDELPQLLPWYRYLFLTKSKPSTHLQALCKITDEELATNAPSELRDLLEYADSKLR
jgi:putative ATP-dependent endonuclease of the OLD family